MKRNFQWNENRTQNEQYHHDNSEDQNIALTALSAMPPDVAAGIGLVDGLDNGFAGLNILKIGIHKINSFLS